MSFSIDMNIKSGQEELISVLVADTSEIELVPITILPHRYWREILNHDTIANSRWLASNVLAKIIDAWEIFVRFEVYSQEHMSAIIDEQIRVVRRWQNSSLYFIQNYQRREI
jgi:spore maturation protein SpmA